jgi:hypothetical protein
VRLEVGTEVYVTAGRFKHHNGSSSGPASSRFPGARAMTASDHRDSMTRML